MPGFGWKKYDTHVGNAFQKFHDYQEDDVRIRLVSYFVSTPGLVLGIKH